MKDTTYIIVMRDDRYFLVGPFADDATAAEWARAHNSADDPRWHTISLHHPGRAPRVFAPVDLDMSEMATMVGYLASNVP